MLAALQNEFSVQYHACVPLGWEPLRVTSSHFVPGYTATATSYEEFLDAVWRGRIPRIDLKSAHARSVFATLNALTGAGMLRRDETPVAYEYYMMPSSIAYFYGTDRYGSNHDSLPYLCYSTIDPQAVIAREHLGGNQFRVTFAWTPGGPASWANSPQIRAHSVFLAPQRSPAFARVFERKGLWGVASVSDGSMMLPAIADASAWR